MRYVYVFEYYGDDGTQVFLYSSKKKARAAMKERIEEIEEQLQGNETLTVIDEQNQGSFAYETRGFGIGGQWYKGIIR